MANFGRFAASSFIQILMSFCICGDMSTGSWIRKPLFVIFHQRDRFDLRLSTRSGSDMTRNPKPIGKRTFKPHCIGENCPNGASLTCISYKTIPKLHMSAACLFKSSGFLANAGDRKRVKIISTLHRRKLDLPSGDIHAGVDIFNLSQNVNLQSAMFIFALRSSSIFTMAKRKIQINYGF